MSKREISDLDLKIKLTQEYLNHSLNKIHSIRLIEDLKKVKIGSDGKVDPDSVSSTVNAFMLTILGSHLQAPFYHPDYISEYKSILQKSNFFNQENIDTIEQFDKIYQEFLKKDDTLFRGQNEAKWRLYSKLQRQWISEGLFNSGESYQTIIERLVDIGSKTYGEQIKKILLANHIDTENPVSILAYLQHHGCPTPLLDWTYKFKNALYFALNGISTFKGTIEIENYFSVYFIEEKHFEPGNIGRIISDILETFEEPELQSLIEMYSNGDEEKKQAMMKHFAGRKVIDRSLLNGSGLITHMTQIDLLIKTPIAYFSDKDKESGILFSLNNSKNILNQAGVFTWCADSSKPIEMVAKELNKEDKKNDSSNYSFCRCFNINKNLVEHARKRLEADGITEEFIYPTPEISTWEIFEKCKPKL